MRIRPAAVLVPVVLAGAAARVGLHGGVTYSQADELVYARSACRVADDGLGAYPDLVGDYLADPVAQLYPPPTRWGFVLPDAVASEVLGCGQATVAWISTAAGIAMIVLVAAFVWRRFGPWVAVVATAFVASSPLQLLLGRRALGDEVVGLVAVAALWATLAYIDHRSVRRLAGVLLLVTAGFATKEIFFLFYPALLAPLAVDWVRARHVDLRDLLVPLVPPLLNAGVVALLARDPDAYLQTVRAVQASSGSPYAEAYLSGPPYRLVLDLMILAPVVVLLAIAAAGLLVDRGTPPARTVGLLAVLSLLPFAVAGVQLVRLVVLTDTLLCVLAAWGVVTALRGRRWWWVPAVVVAVVAVSGWVFWTLSVRHEVYDPVTDNLLRALGIIP